MLLFIGLDRFLRSQREIYMTEGPSYFLGKDRFFRGVVNPTQLL